jgi:hypothetical protein
MEALHKNGASFTALFATRLPSGSEDALFGDISGAALTGIRLIYLFTDRKPVFEVYNAGATALSKSGDTAPPVDQWFFEAISIDENGGNVSFFWRDGAYNQVSGSNTFDAAYTSPAAGNAGVAFEIGAEGNAVDELNCGSRLGLAAFWSSALTKTQLDNIFNKVRGRFNV